MLGATRPTKALAAGMLGMGGTIIIVLAAIVVVLAHLLTIRIPEPRILKEAGHTGLSEMKAGVAAVRATQGLIELILFATFNNLTGGVFMALMDPYRLTLFPVEIWGVVLGVTATGFIIGGALVAKFGLGKAPIRTMLVLVAVTGVLGATFTLREWWWLYLVGIWIVPYIDSRAGRTTGDGCSARACTRDRAGVPGFRDRLVAAGAGCAVHTFLPAALYRLCRGTGR